MKIGCMYCPVCMKDCGHYHVCDCGRATLRYDPISYWLKKDEPHLEKFREMGMTDTVTEQLVQNIEHWKSLGASVMGDLKGNTFIICGAFTFTDTYDIVSIAPTADFSKLDMPLQDIVSLRDYLNELIYDKEHDK